MVAVYEFDNWLDQMRDYRVLGMIDDPRTVSPVPRIRAICSLYFPEFSQRIDELGLAADDYEMWMLKAGQKRAAAGGREVFTDGHVEARHEYMKLRMKLLKDLEAFARRELQ